MEVNSILAKVFSILNRYDMVDILSDSFCENNPECKEMLKFLNVVLQRIATEYIFCFFSEDIIIRENNFYDLSKLQKKFYSIRKIERESGNYEQYVISRNTLHMKKGKYKIKYAYLPKDYTFGENICDFETILTEDAVVLGVLSEYYLKNGFYEEYEIYQYKFESKMKKCTARLDEIKVRKRLWV